MLATLAALQLLAAVQLSASPLPHDGVVPPPGERAEARAAAERDEIPAPAPPPAGEAGDPVVPGRAAPPPATASGERRAAREGVPEKARQQSLLSAESLRGGSAALAWAGWSSLGAAYAIGFSERDDGGLYLDHDWAKSETRIGVLYRRPFSYAGSFGVAARLAVAWYENFGSTWIYDENHSDRGFEVVPGLSLSRHGAGGIFSTIVEAPMTLTTKYENGFLFSPRISFAFELPLYPEVTVGARAGVGYRAGSGGAPIREGRGEAQFLVLVGYQLL